jgi:hypothetical protein
MHAIKPQKLLFDINVNRSMTFLPKNPQLETNSKLKKKFLLTFQFYFLKIAFDHEKS